MVALPGNMNLTVVCTDCEWSHNDPEMIQKGAMLATPSSHCQHFECPECRKEVSITIIKGEPLIEPRTAKGSLD